MRLDRSGRIAARARRGAGRPQSHQQIGYILVQLLNARVAREYRLLHKQLRRRSNAIVADDTLMLPLLIKAGNGRK